MLSKAFALLLYCTGCTPSASPLEYLNSNIFKQAAFDKPFLRPVAFLKTDNILASEEGNFSVIID